MPKKNSAPQLRAGRTQPPSTLRIEQHGDEVHVHLDTQLLPHPWPREKP